MKRFTCFILALIVAVSICGLIIGCADTSNSTVNAIGLVMLVKVVGATTSIITFVLLQVMTISVMKLRNGGIMNCLGLK